MTFEPERTRFRLCDVAGVEAFAGQVPLHQRIKSLLKAGAHTREDIAGGLEDVKPETLRRTLDREIKANRPVEFPTPEGDKRIGLTARAS